MNSRTLLREIIDSENPVQMLQTRFDQSLPKEDNELRSLLRELIQEGFMDIDWADDVPYYIEINNSARTYDEREAEYERSLKYVANSTTTNIFHGNASNVQIQQNTNNSTQNMNVSQFKDFDKAKIIGPDAYISEQKEKVEILRDLLNNYNDGRQKNFFCIAVNLLELQDIRNVMLQIENDVNPDDPVKEKSKTAVFLFQAVADERNISLKLRKKN